MNKLLVILLSFLFSSLTYAQQSNLEYERAVDLLNQKELDEAQIVVKNVLQQNANFLPARLLLGEILLEQGQIESAEKEYTIALALKADVENVIVPLAETKLLQHKHQDALNLLERHTNLSILPRYLTLKATALMALNKPEAAEKTIFKAINIHGQSAEANNLLAQLYLEQDKLAEAKKHAEQALDIVKANVTSRLLLAQIFTKMGATAQALTEYQTLRAAHPKNEKALFGLTQLYLKSENLELALNEVIKLREVAPENPYAKLLHSSIIALQGDHQKARLLLTDIQQQLLSLSDEQRNSQAVLLLSASVNFTNQKFQQARIEYQRYLRDFGENVNVRRQLASIAFREGHLATAKEHIDKALEVPADSAEVYILASQIYQKTSAKGQYFSFIEQAHKRFTNNSILSRLYINALIAKGDIDTANQLLSQVATSSAASKVMLGFVQLQQEQLAEARNTVQSLLDQHPNKIEIIQLAGELSLKLGHQEDAIKFFEHALILDEKFAPALLSMAGIYLNNNSSELAEKTYRKYLAFYPTDEKVLRLYANLAVKQQHFDLAIKLLSNVPESSPAYRQSQASLLSLLVATNQLDKASSLIASLREVDTFNQELLLIKAQVERLSGELEAAKKTLKMLFGLTYDEPEKLIKVASLQLDVQDTEATVKTVTRLKQLTSVPDYLAAKLALSQQDFNRAKSLIAKNIKTKETATSWQELSAYLHIAQADFDKAITVITPIYQQYKKRSHLQLLTQLHSSNGATEKAILLLKDWVKQQNKDAWAISQLAQLAANQGDLDTAIEAYQSFDSLDSQPIFLNNLANLLQQKGQLGEAISAAKKAYELEPNMAPINDTLGWLLVEKGQIQSGLGYLREAVARDANNTTYQLHLAYTLAKLKRFSLAKDAFDKATKIDAHHPLRGTVEEALK